MTEGLILASYPIFKFQPERLHGSDREVAVKEIGALLDDWTERVTVRGIYSLAGFRADADLMMWWVARSPDDVQDLLVALKKTAFGGALEVRDTFLGVVRPAEFSPDHLPAFVKGDEPKKYVCVYPFVRTPEWYLLDPKDRGAMLRSHGEAGRQYPEVLANTTSAFGLGDYEWILCFEADEVERIVELIRHLRGTEARRYTKVEVPFYTGIRKDLDASFADLP